MVEAVLDVKKWGNNLGVRLPAAIVRESHLHEHQRVKLVVANGQITITPLEDEALTLEQRLALFDPTLHGGEVMQASEHVGAEKW